MKSIICTVSSYIYTRILPKFRKSAVAVQANAERAGAIAVICDEMTWQNFERENPAVFVTPKNWKSAFEKSAHKPQMLFCESAWSGIKESKSCWRGQIYRDNRVLYENRRVLLRILEYCKSNKIPTIFWNKEDPAYFRHSIYDFTDTALKFDHIMTTAEECVPKYMSLGHDSVHLWQFGFSPEIFYPPENEGKARENVAVFAGSWYAEQAQRCKDMTEMFDGILSMGIPLKIYDRNRVSGKSSKPFPNKYQSYVHDAIAYEQIGEVYRKAEYVININTTRDSASMFARRVYEVMACGAILISNDSLGMRKQFGSRIWYIGEDFDFSRKDEIRNQNINEVFEKHTNAARMKQLRDII